MTDTPQPVLPAEGDYTDVERLFIDDQPKNLFPENQNSNFGVLRRVLTDSLQEAVDEIDQLYNELFIETASAYLGLWERELGITVAPAGLSDASRRVRLSARRTRGLFSRARLKMIVERYITDTFGAPSEFTAAGIPFTGAGIPMYAEAGDVSTMYRIYENPTSFSYEVWIRSDITPDIASLTRDLTWITPAHISFTIDNTQSDVVNYFRTVRNLQPISFLRFTNGALATDQTAYAHNGTLNGGGPAQSVTDLISAAVGTSHGSAVFDGVNDSITIPDQPVFNFGDQFSVGMWINPASIAATMGLFSKGSASVAGVQVKYDFATKTIQLKERSSGVVIAQSLPNLISVGTTHFLVVRKWGDNVDIFIDNVNVTDTRPAKFTFVKNTNSLFIGAVEGATFFNGTMDEFTLFNQFLTDAQIASLYHAGMNIA